MGRGTIEGVKTSIGNELAVIEEKAFDAGYTKGLEDGWELAKEVMKIPIHERADIFGVNRNNHIFLDIAEKHSAASAKELISNYKHHIETGDEVIVFGCKKGLAIRPHHTETDDPYVDVLFLDDYSIGSVRQRLCEKTGKKCNELEHVIKTGGNNES